jgi:hypothetical protein
VPELVSGAQAASPPPQIFHSSFLGCTKLDIGYDYFPPGVVVSWNVHQPGNIGNASLGSGTFTAISGGKNGAKTYHFLQLPLTTRLLGEPAAEGIIDISWRVGSVKYDYFKHRDPGCGGGGPPPPPPPPPPGSCLPSSSLGVLVNISGKNVVTYIPKGNWENSTTGIGAINVEGTSITPKLISTPNAANSSASNPNTGKTVATANNTDVYILSGTTLTNTLTSGGSGTIGFSGGSATNTGVAMDAVHNQAVIGESVAGSPGFQFLNLATNTFGVPFKSPSGDISEDPLIDPSRKLLLSASEEGNYEIVNISNPAAPKFFENATGLGELDSSGEDCSTGLALAPSEGPEPTEVYIADLSQAKFTPGTPSGTWTAPSQIQTLSESDLSAGGSGLSIAQGTHTGVVVGEFGGNTLTAISLPSTSGSGTPAIKDWVTCGIANTPDGNPWSEGLDPHTVTAYQSPNGGDAIGLFGDGGPNWVARVDLTKLLNKSVVTRTAGGHACSAGTIPSTVENFIAVP